MKKYNNFILQMDDTECLDGNETCYEEVDSNVRNAVQVNNNVQIVHDYDSIDAVI